MLPRRLTALPILALGMPLVAAQDLEPVGPPSRSSAASEDGLELIAPRLPGRKSLERPPPSGDTDALTNTQVVAMTEARFGTATIVAAMAANETRFDVSPSALLALKNAGVSDRVIEEMIGIEVGKRDTPETDETLTPESLARLSEAIELLARQPEAVRVEDLPQGAQEGGQEGAQEAAPLGPGPHAWIVRGADRAVFESTTAEVALTDQKGRGSTALGALRSLGQKALAFATPALGIAKELELGGIFKRDDPKMTAVWALPGASASRTLEPETVLEVAFDNIPGVDPDDYRPQVVELVPTRDNYRLVGAARARLSELDEGMPAEPITEEPVAADIEALSRGRYRIALGGKVPPGEYALVLRPVDQRRARRDEEPSLSALMRPSGTDILYITWDFSVRDFSVRG